MAVDGVAGDGGAEVPPRSAPAIASVPPARDSGATRRRLALRIPDDEISRPNVAGGDGKPKTERLPPDPPPVQGSLNTPLTPMRIITISDAPPPVVASDALGDPKAEAAVAFDDSVPPPASSQKARLELHPEDEFDVDFDDEVLTPVVARVPESVLAEARGSTPTLPVDHPEIGSDELVAVDSSPSPESVLPPMRPRAVSHPGFPPPSKRGPPVPPRPSLVIVPPHVGSMPSQGDPSGARRKGRLWWEDLFNDDYVRTGEKIADDQLAREVAFIEESLAVERGGAILDLACGTGRHATELAKRGYEVVGFDLSLAMLARAGEEAQDRGARLNFVQGDMREMSFDEQFDGVYSWNTSFGYFEEDKNAQVIERVYRSLKGGGQFLLDVVNRDFMIRQSPSLAWFEGDGCVCMDEMSVDFITSRMKVKRTMMLDDGRSREIEYSVRVYSLHELGRILHEQGFKVREISGRIATPGVFFGNESPRAIILAEKR